MTNATLDPQPPHPLTELATALPPAELELLSPRALDQLPYGVIALELDGRIARYNLAESRFARLDRAQVLGRTFFGEIAPCTATPEFQGRFQALAAGGAPGETVRFTYIFDFKFGAQLVDIEMVRAGIQPWILVLVNRQRFMPQREDLPEGFAAPLQAELEPGAPGQGVQRQDRQARVARLETSVFGALRAAFEVSSSEGYRAFTEAWGFQWGRLAVVDLETEASEQLDRTLRDLPMQEVLDRLGDWVERQGLGRLSGDFSLATQGAFLMNLERSAIAEGTGLSESPRCGLHEGLYRAVFSHLARKRLAVREVACASQGHPGCTFAVVSEAREAQLEAAAAQADGDVPALLAALRAGTGRG